MYKLYSNSGALLHEFKSVIKLSKCNGISNNSQHNMICGSTFENNTTNK